MHDVVIVGAGSAGCVLAEKLSRDPARRVLLLEAGPRDGHVLLRMPAGVVRAIGDPRFDWRLRTVPQRHMDGRRLGVPRGRVLGGSSAINALVYMRGQPSDFDAWAAMGCPGWAWDDVAPAFAEIEGNRRFGPPHHGRDGPLIVSDPESGNPVFEAFVEAGRQMGLPVTDDFNGPSPLGFGPYQLNIADGRRWSAADAFLHPAGDRPNLEVRTGAQVGGLRIEGGRATGVRLADGMLPAGHVVLAAGAIGSPHLLLLSGIGPADHLASRGVAVATDRPGVGANLHDHLEAKVKMTLTRPLSMWRHARFPMNLLAGARWLATRAGPGRQQALEAGAMIRLANGDGPPDTQLHMINALSFDGAMPADRAHGYAIDTTQVQPLSRGTLRLASDDPGAAPLIDPNYLAAPQDRVAMRDGLAFLRDLCRQPALAAITGAELRPGPGVTDAAGLDAVVRATADSIYHPVGTARMGAADDPGAVVDPATMGVHGLAGLSVADASVMPRITSGNTHAPSVMIGTKGADLIAAALG
jgi:choline dehydrogenase